MKKILLCIIAVTLTAFVAPCHADTWNGVSSDTSWYVEGQTEYHIQNAAQLKGLADLVNNQSLTFDGCTVYLDTDIDLNHKQWIPIGYRNVVTQSVTFNGDFDAQGFSIENLNINSSQLPNNGGIFNMGLFGNSEGEITNLILNGEINIGEGETMLASLIYVGGIVGHGHNINNSKCNVTINFNDITHSLGTPNLHIGLAAGAADDVQYVKASGAMWFNSYYPNKGIIGSVVGKARLVNQCASDAYLAVPGAPGDFYDLRIGGIVGECPEVSNCIFTGTASVYNHSGATDKGIFFGGICSGMETGTISDCIFAPNEFKTNLGFSYYGMIVPLTGTTFIVNNSYYNQSFANPQEFYGIGTTADFLQSGSPISGFNTDVWDFKEGSYPLLKALKTGYKISVPVENGRISFYVIEGGDVTMFISPEAEWKLQTLYIDGEDFTSYMNGNKYMFEGVNRNHVVTAVFQNNVSDIQAVNMNGRKISLEIKNGKLFLKGVARDETVNVYGVDGRIVKKTTVWLLPNMALNNGIYIIKVNDDAFKVNL